MAEKICHIMGARELGIAWGDNPEYWKWMSDADSRFPEVAKLTTVWWLDIHGTISLNKLSPNTVYAAFLVFKLVNECDEVPYGLESVNGIIEYVNVQSEDDAEKQSRIVHLQQVPEGEGGENAANRADGWMEVEIGRFNVNEGDDDKQVKAEVFESSHWKGGLIVEGIEFRPTSNVE